MSETTVVKMPAAREIDALILKYDKLKTECDDAQAKKKTCDDALAPVKTQLIEMIESHGSKHAEKSKKLAGAHNSAMITTGTTTVVVDANVERLREYLEKAEVEGLSERFFTRTVTYQLVASPGEVLKTVSLATKIRNRITLLLAVCFEQKAKAPSLKVDVVTPEAA